MSPQATRLDDNCTGHDDCGPVPLITSSPNVLINRRGAGRKTDIYASHGCLVHPPHNDVIAKGSATVFINGLEAGRVGDDVSIGGNVQDGSPNVIIGG